VLGCWDEGIGRLEDLIEQKRLRKKGLMQKLLTGDKRLPGFSEDWKEVQLKTILKRTEPYEKLADNKAYPLVSIRRHAGGIFDRGLIPREEISYEQMACLKRHNFVISKRQVSHGAYGLVSDNHVGCYVSAEYVILEPITNDLHMPFLEWLSKERLMWHKGYVSSNGVHLEKLILDPKHFLRHTIPLLSIDEQKAIAAVLRTADEEIQLLEAELDALREQKKGLMQKLLTGEVRCPEFRNAS
jgi:type I restriction enzyme S subunit